MCIPYVTWLPTNNFDFVLAMGRGPGAGQPMFKYFSFVCCGRQPGALFLFEVVGAIPCFGEGRREQDLAIHFVWFLFRGAAGGGSW